MSEPAVLTARARADPRDELLWIGPDYPAKARRVRDAVLIAANRLGSHPLIGRMQLHLLPEPYRFWSLTQVQVVLVYNPASRPPRILRILSTAREFGPLLRGLIEPETPGDARS